MVHDETLDEVDEDGISVDEDDIGELPVDIDEEGWDDD